MPALDVLDVSDPSAPLKTMTVAQTQGAKDAQVVERSAVSGLSRQWGAGVGYPRSASSHDDRFLQ